MWDVDRRTCDVLVVGAGPAGAMAARTAAEAGVRVLLVDAKRRIGSLPHCAEFIPRRTALDLTVPDRSAVQLVELTDTCLPDRTVSVNTPGVILDRARFDHGLAEAAASAGAEIQAGTRLIALEGGRYLLRGPLGDVAVEAAVAVAADGAGSRLRRLLGGASLRRLTGVQMEVALRRPMDRLMVLFDRAWRYGYAWLFPKGPVANLGVGMFETRPGEAWAALHHLAADMIRRDLIRPGALARSVGAIPVSGPSGGLIRQRVLLAGDAGGLTHPITGAGVPQALFSGESAGRAAADFVRSGDRTDMLRYETDVLSQYGRSLSWAVRKREWLEAHWNQTDFSAVVRESWPMFREYRS